ncbi:MAG: VCBS repeat-containing protein, partial [Chitinophagales bacterium]|nr:VCBS repeat-containing protein [Chitinophagales bacterium]
MSFSFSLSNHSFYSIAKYLVIAALCFSSVTIWGQFSQENVITSIAMGMQTPIDLHNVDMDNDGDLDVLVASYGYNKIVWYENEDGNGTFGKQKLISDQVALLRAIYAADLDGDGDMDVLSTSSLDNKVAWYKNEDGNGNFGMQLIISEELNHPNDVYSADINGDGNMDVLVASAIGTNISWFRNEDGQGNFGFIRTITTQASWAQS